MKGNLQKYALIAEIIGAVSVVISMAIVGMQVRMGADQTALNTAAIRSSAFQELQTRIADLQVLLIENPEFRQVFQKLMLNEEIESADQRIMLDAWLRLVLRHGEMVYMQYEQGLIEGLVSTQP